jgi:hypothetical protein
MHVVRVRLPHAALRLRTRWAISPSMCWDGTGSLAPPAEQHAPVGTGRGSFHGNNLRAEVSPAKSRAFPDFPHFSDCPPPRRRGEDLGQSRPAQSWGRCGRGLSWRVGACACSLRPGLVILGVPDAHDGGTSDSLSHAWRHPSPSRARTASPRLHAQVCAHAPRACADRSGHAGAGCSDAHAAHAAAGSAEGEAGTYWCTVPYPRVPSHPAAMRG